MTSDQIAVSLGLLLGIVAVIGTFAFVSVVVFSENRRKEREAFYRTEVHKKLVEQEGGKTDQLRALLHVEEVTRARQIREALRIAGLATGAAGIGMVILGAGGGEWALWKIGYVPAAVGLAMLVYGLLPSSVARQQA